MAVSVPSFLPCPWARNGQSAAIPQSTDEAGRASWEQGFPQACALPLSAGGIPPNYLDFQGIFKAISEHLYYAQTGALWPWSASLTYPAGARVLGSDGAEYVARQENSGRDPTSDASSAYWRSSSAALQAVGMVAPFASRTLPEGWMLCDGSLILFADWPDFKAAYDAGRFTGMTLSSASSSQKGKFVLKGSTGLYLPDLEGLFVQAGAATAAGAYVKPGVPDVTGSFIPTGLAGAAAPEGAFYAIASNVTDYSTDTRTGYGAELGFKASLSSAIYGASSTVQPPAVKYCFAMYLGEPA